METFCYNQIAVGKLMQKARKAVGLTQKMAAKALGYSNSHLIQIENGASGLSIDSLLALCALYHITPNDVFHAGIAEFQACEDETIFLSSYKSLSNEKRK